MNIKELQFSFHAPLNSGDSETQTYGCRANNPNICKNADSVSICAFTTTDHICKKPSRAWKKQFLKLREAQNGTKD